MQKKIYKRSITLFSIILLYQISNIFSQQAQSSYTVVLPQDEYDFEVRDYMRQLEQPIVFTRTGIKQYLKYVYNHPDYCTEYVPHSFKHLIEFLEYGKKTEQDLLYMQASLRLFGNKVKATRYVTAQPFLDLIEKMPELFEGYFVCTQDSCAFTLKKQITSVFYDSFLHKFSFFKESPESFLNDVASEVIATVQASSLVQKEVDREQLRQTVVRFLETSLTKIIWSPFDQEQVWESVKNIAKHCGILKDKNIISHDNLDDLFRSLLERFCYFLDLAGSDLSIDTINKIKEDISMGNLQFLELEEPEDFMQTKSDRLTRVIIKTEAKVRARTFGILSEVPGY